MTSYKGRLSIEKYFCYDTKDHNKWNFDYRLFLFSKVMRVGLLGENDGTGNLLNF